MQIITMNIGTRNVIDILKENCPKANKQEKDKIFGMHMEQEITGIKHLKGASSGLNLRR